MRFSEYLDRAAGLYPDHEAFVDGEFRINYKSARDIVHKIANVLSSSVKLPFGSKVAVYSPNAAMAYLCVVGLNRADMVWLPINYRNTLETQLNFFDADCIFFHSSFNDQIAEILGRAPNLKTAICIDASSSHASSLPELMDGVSSDHFNELEDPAADAAIMPTGGTTGPSKGALQTHRGVEAMLINQMLLDIPEHPRYLAVSPITHAAGYFIPIMYTR